MNREQEEGLGKEFFDIAEYTKGKCPDSDSGERNLVVGSNPTSVTYSRVG